MSTNVLPDRLEVAGLSFAVEARPTRRTIEVIVERDASLSVKVPEGRSVEEVASFIDTNRGWIHRKLAEKDALLGPTITKEFVDGEGFLYLGRSHRLKLVDPVGSASAKAGGRSNAASAEAGGRSNAASAEAPDVRLVRGRFELRRDRVDDGVAVMRSWYASTGTAWLERRLSPWVNRFGGLGDIDVQVDTLGYRWGSARPGGRVNLHWASLQLPPGLVDYVLVHELAHLHEPNHTPEFWSQVERVLPDASARRDELSQVGATIWLG